VREWTATTAVVGPLGPSVRYHTPSLFQELKHVLLVEQHYVANFEVREAFMCHPVLDGPCADPAKQGDFMFPPEGVSAKGIIIVFHALLEPNRRGTSATAH
jgi:hypothetical protein